MYTIDKLFLPLVQKEKEFRVYKRDEGVSYYVQYTCV